jgi:hypothetical protein
MTTLLSFGVLYTIATVSTPSPLNPTRLANPDHYTTYPETTAAITTPLPPPPHETDEHDNGACGNTMPRHPVNKHRPGAMSPSRRRHGNQTANEKDGEGKNDERRRLSSFVMYSRIL